MIEIDSGFQWDSAKSQDCVRVRGFSFVYAALIWRGKVVEREDERHDYGETRYQALGQIGDDYYVVVYTWRGERRHIISARRAHLKEARRWGVL